MPADLLMKRVCPFRKTEYTEHLHTFSVSLSVFGIFTKSKQDEQAKLAFLQREALLLV